MAYVKEQIASDALKPLVHKGNDKYLVEDDYVAAYYLPSVSPVQWQDTFSAYYQVPGTHTALTGVAAFKTAILAHEYKVSIRVTCSALAMLAANRYVSRPETFTSYSVTWQAGA